jgi:hypothetical protein
VVLTSAIMTFIYYHDPANAKDGDQGKGR